MHRQGVETRKRCVESRWLTTEQVTLDAAELGLGPLLANARRDLKRPRDRTRLLQPQAIHREGRDCVAVESQHSADQKRVQTVN